MTTTVSRVLVKTSPNLVLEVKTPSIIRAWSVPWFNREAIFVPVYFAYRKEFCDAGQAPMLPANGDELRIIADAPTSLWMKAESDVIVCFCIDPLKYGGLI